MRRSIDAHMHFGDDHPAALALLDDLKLKYLNVCVADTSPSPIDGEEPGSRWRTQAELYQTLAQRFPERYAWCTTFDLPHFDADFVEEDYVGTVIGGLDRDFDAGALACKIWKHFGMLLKDRSGQFVLVDDPLLDPVFSHIARAGRTLLTHIGSGPACWQPPTPDNPHLEWYKNNPQWYMYDKSGYPSRQELTASRDRLLEKHPDLRVIGAHLACLEDDLPGLGERLDRYPNFAVDTSARLVNLALLDRDQVRQFFLDYQDRILFGTDIGKRKNLSAMTDDERKQALQSLRESHRLHHAYFGTDQMVSIRGRQVQGLGLPQDVLEKLFVTNAQQWYPGL